MKTAEELTAIKEAVETLNKKLAELTEEELEQVTGGYQLPIHIEGLSGITKDIMPKERDIALTGDFTGNYANGSGGGVINEGKF